MKKSRNRMADFAQEVGWRHDPFSGKAWKRTAMDLKRFVREKLGRSFKVCGFAFAGDNCDSPTGVVVESRAGKRHTIELNELLERRAQ